MKKERTVFLTMLLLACLLLLYLYTPVLIPDEEDAARRLAGLFLAKLKITAKDATLLDAMDWNGYVHVNFDVLPRALFYRLSAGGNGSPKENGWIEGRSLYVRYYRFGDLYFLTNCTATGL